MELCFKLRRQYVADRSQQSNGGRNLTYFESLAELRALTDAWLWIYNGERPRDSLGRMPQPMAHCQSPRPYLLRSSLTTVR